MEYYKAAKRRLLDDPKILESRFVQRGSAMRKLEAKGFVTEGKCQGHPGEEFTIMVLRGD